MSDYPRNQNNFNNLVNPDYYYNHYTMNVVPNYQEQQDVYYDPNIWHESYVQLPTNRQSGFPIINHVPYYSTEYNLYYPTTHDLRSVNMTQYQYILQQNPQQQSGQMNVARSELYKTQLCRNFESERSCRYGDMCQFAHGTGDLRQTPKSRNTISNNNNVNRRFQIEQQNRSMSSNSHSTIPSISQSSRQINLANNISITSEKSINSTNSIMDTFLSTEVQNLNNDSLVESFQNIRISSSDDNDNITQVNENDNNNSLNITNNNNTIKNSNNDTFNVIDDNFGGKNTLTSSTHKFEGNKNLTSLSSSSLPLLSNPSSLANNTVNTGANNNMNKKSTIRKNRSNEKSYNSNNPNNKINYSDNANNINNNSNDDDISHLLSGNMNNNNYHDGGNNAHFVNHDLPETSVWLKRHQY